MIFSSFGSLCKPAHEYFTKKALDAKGQDKISRFLKVISFSFARSMAFRLRRGAGFIPFDPPAATSKLTTQAVARGCDPDSIPPEYLTAPAFRQEHLHPKVRPIKAKRRRSTSPPREKRKPKKAKTTTAPTKTKENKSCRNCKQAVCRQGNECKTQQQQQQQQKEDKVEKQSTLPTHEKQMEGDTPIGVENSREAKPLQEVRPKLCGGPHPLYSPPPSPPQAEETLSDSSPPQQEGPLPSSSPATPQEKGTLPSSGPALIICSSATAVRPQELTSPLQTLNIVKKKQAFELEGDDQTTPLRPKIQRGRVQVCHPDCVHKKYPSQRRTHDVFCPRSKLHEQQHLKPAKLVKMESGATDISQASETSVLARSFSVLGYPVRGPDKNPRKPRKPVQAESETAEEVPKEVVGKSAPDSVRSLKRKAAHQLPQNISALQPSSTTNKRPPPVPLTRSRPPGKK